jgi:putative colanic acid biosysnthesis UDP-glucose lipid carrier transferase
MSNRYTNLFRFFFVCVDLVALCLVHIALILNFHRISPDGERPYGLLFLVGNMLWLIAAYGMGLYIEDGQPNVYRFSVRTIKAFILYALCMMMFAFLYHYPFSRLFILLNFAGFALLLLFTRLGMIGVSYLMKKVNGNSKRVVIVGYNDLSRKFVERFSINHRDFQIDGYFEDPDTINELSRYPIIGNINECLDYAIKNNVQEIYSAISPEKNASIYEMASQAEKSLIRFKFIPDFRLFVNRETYIEYHDNFPILSLRPEPLEDMGNSTKKRLFDIFFSLLVIVFILSWLIPILAILILITSRGNVFFRQKRSGKNNKQFTCYKLRTMTVNQDAHLRQVTLNDSRVTKLGRMLRKTNMDELPQFINVLLGNMSIIGPRPHMLVHTHMYSKIMNEYMIRHFLKPGISGWAQVNGYRGEIKEEAQLRRRIDHDIWYMENWSIWLDMKIIWLTIYRTIKGDKNAY